MVIVINDKEYEVTNEEFDYLFSEQTKGKDLKPIDGKVVAVERVITEEEKAQARINELKLWFDTEYTKLEQKYRRLRTLNKLCDDGSNPESKLLELYNIAEQKRFEIQQLEEVNDDKGIDC